MIGVPFNGDLVMRKVGFKPANGAVLVGDDAVPGVVLEVFWMGVTLSGDVPQFSPAEIDSALPGCFIERIKQLDGLATGWGAIRRRTATRLLPPTMP